jgi:hypothetical protein
LIETFAKIDTSIEEAIANRRDMRDTLTLLIRKMLKILMMLYHLKIRINKVHIADVSYYLEEEVFLMTKRIKETFGRTVIYSVTNVL